MNGKLTLNIAISTYGPEGILRVEAMNLPVIDRVNYIVSWQKHENAPIPESLKERKDVAVYRFDTLGQSHNRNNSIAQCSADIVLISDDDLTYYPEGIRQILTTYEENPGLEFATFICVHESPRILPKEPTRLGLPYPKGYSIGAWELSFRRESLMRKGIRFHPLLGLNSDSMHGGEDEFFMLCAVKNNLDCRFFPIEICEHPHESTGTKSRMTAANVRAAGCIIRLTYPSSWLPRIALKAWRLSRSGQFPLLKGVAVLMQGAFKAQKVGRGQW